MTGRRLRTGLLVAMGSIAAVPLLSAQPTLNVKLGLWEVTSTSQTSGMPPIDTSAMTPEQRTRAEAMMKSMMQGMAKTRTTKGCLTQEKLEKDLFDDRDMDASCRRTVVTSTPTLQEINIECSGEHPMTGQARFEAVTPELVNGTVRMKVGGSGQAMNVESTFKAKWLAASCGDVKP